MAGYKDNLLGEANSFIEVLEQVSRLAPLDKPVLVIGERGTGKELIATACTTSQPVGKARLFHLTAPRSTKIYLIPNSLGTKRAPLPARRNVTQVGSSAPMAAHCFLMNWQPPRCWYRKNCCALLSTESWNA